MFSDFARRGVIATLMSGIATISLVPAVMAQEDTSAPADATMELGLGEIVVTATRRAESLQDVPMSIDVATGEQIQKLNMFDFKDVQQLAPGLQLTNDTGRGNKASLRGIGHDPDSGANPTVDVYFNEFSIDAQVAFSAIYDIGQIEVLRGPQGTLRGRTAPAGAIILNTRRANLAEPEGYMQGTVTDRDGLNLQGGVSIPVVPDVFAVRIAALVDQNDGNQVKNVSRGDSSRNTTESVRFSATYEPNPDFSVHFTYQYLHGDNRQYYQVIGAGNQPSLLDPARSGPAADINDRIATSEGLMRYRKRSHLATLAADWTLGTHTLSLITGYQDSRLRQQTDFDFANAVPGYISEQHVTTPYRTMSAELRLASDFDGAFNYTVGTFLYRQKTPVFVEQQSDQFFGTEATPFPASMNLIAPINTEVGIPGLNKIYAGFVSGRVDITDSLKLEAGVRYTILNTKQQSYLSVSSPGNAAIGMAPSVILDEFPTIPDEHATRKNKPLTGGASLTYQVTDDVTTYLSYGRSYRGRTVTSGLLRPLDPSITVTKAETSDAVEFGFKSSLADRRISVNAALFYQKFNNFLSRTPNQIVYASGRDGNVDGRLPFNFNGDAEVKGVEGQINGRLLDQWDFSLSASYTDAKFKNALAPCNDYNGDGTPDEIGAPRVPLGQQVGYCTLNGRISETPKFNLSLTSEYRFEVGAYEPFIRGLFTYKPGFRSEQAQFDYKSQSMLNLFVGVRDDERRWELTAFARNLLNQQRITNISVGTFQQGTTLFTGEAGAPFDSGYRLVNVTNPREFGLTLQFNF